MKNREISFKFRVFISSACDGKYSKIRDDLKCLLKGTELFEVYVYEQEPASSKRNEQAYKERMGICEACIFLIDNADGIPDGVMKEHLYAQGLNIRKLYLFCNEREKNATSLQKELRESASLKYKAVEKFDDFADIAYCSIMQDLVDYYRPERISEAENNTGDPTKELVPEPVSFSYCISKNRPFTTKALAHAIGQFLHVEHWEEPALSEEEEACFQLFSFLMGAKTFDLTAFAVNKESVLSSYDDAWKPFFDLRFQAVEKYYQGELDTSIHLLQAALKIAVTTEEIPQWLALDVAVDLRFVLNKKDKMGNRFHPLNEGQSFIDDSSEPLFYPLLDRKAAEFQERLINFYHSRKNCNPYTVNIGGDLGISQLTDIFVTAMMHGSLIQLELLKRKIISLLLMLCELYYDIRFWKLLVKLLILDGRQKDLDSLLRQYHCSEYISSPDDIEDLWQASNTLPYPHERMRSKYILLSTLGNYMDDADFQLRSHELIGYSYDWLDDANAYMGMEKPIFDFYSRNCLRIDIGHSLKFINKVFTKRLCRFYDAAIDLIRDVCSYALDDGQQKQILDFLCMLAENTEKYKNTLKLEGAMIRFTAVASIDISKLAQIIADKNPSFFEGSFKLESIRKGREEYYPHIRRYIQLIHENNAKQGANGVYFYSSTDGFGTIRNIIAHDDVTLNMELMDEIVDAYKETMLSQDQLINAKISATKMMLAIYCKHRANYDFSSLRAFMIENMASLTSVSRMPSFDQSTPSMLGYVVNLFMERVDGKNNPEIIEYLYSIDEDEPFEIIKALESTCDFLKADDAKTTHDHLLYAFLHFAILRCSHRERDIRFGAIRCLIVLTGYKQTQKMAISQLSYYLDKSDPIIKMTILSRLDQIHGIENETVDHMLKKASLDGHWQIRAIAEREKKKRQERA